MTNSKPSFVNHPLHIILSIISLGIWLPVYLGYYLIRKLSGSTRDARAIRKQEIRKDKQKRRQERMATAAQRPGFNAPTSKPKLGYKKGGKFGSPYILECNHYINVSVRTAGAIGMLGKEVFCQVCNATRRVAASKNF